MKFKTLSVVTLIGIPLVVVAYLIFITVVTWPISEFSINKAGAFGDSFGILTSLFSGLAFSGVIITALLQREELKLQRKELEENRVELSKSAIAQARTAQLSALSALLNECDNRLTAIENELRFQSTRTTGILASIITEKPTTELLGEKECLEDRKLILSVEIEEILKEIGISLQ